jgi:hypothetical protein
MQDSILGKVVAMADITLSDVGQAVSALNTAMQKLYRESFDVSAQQEEHVKKFAKDMKEFGERQRDIARKLVALEDNLQKLLKRF